VEFAEPARRPEYSIGGISLLGSVAACKGKFPVKIVCSCFSFRAVVEFDSLASYC